MRIANLTGWHLNKEGHLALEITPSTSLRVTWAGPTRFLAWLEGPTWALRTPAQVGVNEDDAVGELLPILQRIATEQLLPDDDSREEEFHPGLVYESQRAQKVLDVLRQY